MNGVINSAEIIIQFDILDRVEKHGIREEPFPQQKSQVEITLVIVVVVDNVGYGGIVGLPLVEY